MATHPTTGLICPDLRAFSAEERMQASLLERGAYADPAILRPGDTLTPPPEV